jgi:hypothetical protein
MQHTLTKTVVAVGNLNPSNYTINLELHVQTETNNNPQLKNNPPQAYRLTGTQRS